LKLSDDFYTTYDIEYYFVTNDTKGREFTLGGGKMAIVSPANLGPPSEQDFIKSFLGEFGVNVIVKQIHVRREKIRMITT